MEGEQSRNVVLRVKDEPFLCDKEVLCKHSPYFYAMFNNDFKEKNQDVINIQDLEPEAFRFIINSLNASPDFTKCHNILEVLEASSMLQFDNIQSDCVQFIIRSRLDKETWLPTSNVADKLGLSYLKNKTKTLALWHFSEVRKTEHFLHLLPGEVMEYLNDDKLRTTEGEFEVFEAGVNWIEFNPDDRLFYTLPLLRVVRFKDMDNFDIRNMLHFTSVKDTPQAELIVECILEIKDGVLNVSCESCNPPVPEDVDISIESGKSSPLPTGMFFKTLKRKRRTTSHCTCFDNTTIKIAQELLDKDVRCLPLIPCIAASLPTIPVISIESHSPRQKFRQKTRLPYMFHFDEDKLVPFIHLTKIDEGLSEAIGFKVVIKDLKLYVIGGEYMMGKGDWNTSIWFYDTCREIWQYECSLPSPRRHHSAVCVNNDLYIIGGVGKHRVMLDSVDKYNLLTKTWESCSSLPTTLYSTGCCVFKEDIYLFGSQLFCYRQATSSWETLTNICLPDNMAVATAMSDNETIYIIGVNAKLYSFVPYPERVEAKFLGQFKVPGSNACLVNKSIFSFGEEDEVQSVEEYSLTRRTFTMLCCYNSDENPPNFCFSQAAGCFPLPKYY